MINGYDKNVVRGRGGSWAIALYAERTHCQPKKLLQLARRRVAEQPTPVGGRPLHNPGLPLRGTKFKEKYHVFVTLFLRMTNSLVLSF